MPVRASWKIASLLSYNNIESAIKGARVVRTAVSMRWNMNRLNKHAQSELNNGTVKSRTQVV